MKLNKKMKILIVGLGLIGGSYARALSRGGYRVFAIDRDPDAIQYALGEGLIEAGYTVPEEAPLGEFDLTVLALYPHILLTWVEQYGKCLRPGSFVTDVTGVKGSLVGRVQEILPDTVEFIAAHPMAGRERSGVRESDDSVFRGANYIVVPTARNTEGAKELCRDLGAALGFSRISELSAEEHDRMIGFVSQLTHCIAISLMTCNTTENLELYTGDSFRDLTRIARLNDEMWSELFLWNKDALLSEMDAFTKELDTLRDMIARGDREALRDLMRKSTARRALFDKKKD